MEPDKDYKRTPRHATGLAIIYAQTCFDRYALFVPTIKDLETHRLRDHGAQTQDNPEKKEKANPP